MATFLLFSFDVDKYAYGMAGWEWSFLQCAFRILDQHSGYQLSTNYMSGRAVPKYVMYSLISNSN